MSKKYFIAIMCFIMLFSGFGPLAYGQGVTEEATASSPAGSQALPPSAKGMSVHVTDPIEASQSNMSVSDPASLDSYAVQQVKVKDFSSLYLNEYGEDAVSASTGNLLVRNTDFILPGMISFQLVRQYDSSSANEEIGAALDATSGLYVNKGTLRKEEVSSALGRGWKWELPYIQDEANGRYLYFPGVGRYKMDDNLKLIGFPWKNINIQFDSTINVSGNLSKYKVTLLNGYHYYLDQDGNLILIQDNYRNKVEFNYSPQNGHKVLSKITNSDGNSLSFSYSPSQFVVEQTGTNRKYVYKQSVDQGISVLSEVIDPLLKSTKYQYDYPAAIFNIVSSYVGNTEKYGTSHPAMLKRIIHPTLDVTDFEYESYVKQLGAFATQTVFKVKSRVNSYQTEANEVKLGQRLYSYSNEDLTYANQHLKWTTTVSDTNAKEIFNFKKLVQADASPDLIYLDEYRQTGDAASRVQQFAYDESVRSNVPVQMKTFHTKDGNNSEILTIDSLVDERGLIRLQKSSEGQEVKYEYQNSGPGYYWSAPSKITTKLNANESQVEEYSYNEQGSILGNQAKEGAIGKVLAQTNYQYDAYGNPSVVETKDDARTISYKQAYQSPYGRHFLTEQSLTVKDISLNSSVIKTKFDYDPAGLLRKRTNTSGHEESYTYDAMGRQTSVVFSDKTTATTQYNDSMNQVKQIAPDGIVTTRLYSPFGQLIQEQTDDAVLKYGYDKEGNLISHTDAEQNTTKYEYDAFQRVVRTVYPNGTYDRVSYDDIDRTVTTIDMTDNRQREVYDILGRRTESQESKNGSFVTIESLEYDIDGRLVLRTDGNKQQTSYTYDALNRLISVKDPKQQVTQYKYSLAGNLVQVQLPDQQKVTKVYDELGRLIQETDASNKSAKYYYDDRDNLVQFVDRSNQRFIYQYNSENMLTGEAGLGFSNIYTYDHLGRRTSMKDNQGLTQYKYDPANGSLIEIIYPDGTKVNYEYNTQMRTGYSITAPSGSSTQVQNELDEMNRVKGMDIKSNAGNARAITPIDRMTFEYESNNLLKKYSFGTGMSTSYTFDGYDLAGMATTYGEKNLGEFGYQYDGNKNILTRTQNGATDQFSYDELNRISSEIRQEKKESYTYDANGNRKSTGHDRLFGMANATFTFDSLDRIVKVAGEGKEVSYKYNGDGLLYERTEGNQRSRYYYDEQAKLIAEAQIASNGTAELTYVYVYDLNGALYARQDKKTGQMQYYQLNGHGDVIGLADRTGKELNSYAYDIWGGPEKEEETVPNILRYSGEYWDSTVGLQYLRARWYDPSAGRFMSEDTYKGSISNPLSLNLYAYVENNPLVYTDPTGNKPCQAFGPECVGSGRTGSASGYGGGSGGFKGGGSLSYSTGYSRPSSVTGSMGGGISRISFSKNTEQFLKSTIGKKVNSIQSSGKGTGNSSKNIFGLDSSKTMTATELRGYAKSQGWTKTQTANGPEKWVDGNGVARITIKGGSDRAPGSAAPHVEIKDASGQRIDPMGNSVTRKSEGNHTTIDLK